MSLRTLLGVKTFRQTYGVARYSRYTRSSPAFWQAVLPVVGEFESVVDLGAGSGAWLAELLKLRPSIDCVGIEHPAVPTDGIHIAREQFVHADLTQPLNLNRRFDLALCLEVSEHLPSKAADTLVDSITHHADTAIFSCAVPGQGGANHVNEQWPGYWIEKFAERGHRCRDVIRPLIWMNPHIAVWYRQNTLLFTTRPGPAEEGWGGLPFVHPELFEQRRRRRPLFRRH